MGAPVVVGSDAKAVVALRYEPDHHGASFRVEDINDERR